jgi:aminopeptidase N
MTIALRSRAATLALAMFAGGCLFGGGLDRGPDPAPRPAVTAPAPPPLSSGRLPALARPTRYRVSLDIDPAKDRFFGDVTIALDLPKPTQVLVLHGRDLLIGRAEAEAAGKRVTAEATFRMAAGGREAPDELVLSLAEPLPAGAAEVRISYSAPIGDRLSGLFRVKEEGALYTFTLLEPTDARRVLPCFDEPGFKAPFELSVTAPKGNLVLANAPEIERADADEGKSITYRFAPTPPLPTYLFAVAVGPFEVREGPKTPVPIRLVAPRGRAALGALALETAAAHVELLASYFDRPFPYPKLDLVAVPEFGFAGMENTGLISLRDDLVLLDRRTASAEAQHAMASSLSHEIAHHWFGDLVTMAWWDDLWLNEGFATWIEGRIIDAWRPAAGARMEALRARHAVMELDGLDSARAVRGRVAGSADAEEAFDDMTYDKSAAVLSMLESWIGPDAFQRGVRAYLKAHEHGSARAADLFDALGKAAGRDVGEVAATFLDQPGVPLVRAQLFCPEGEPPRVSVTTERYAARGRGAKPAWKIPVCIAFDGDRAAPACGLVPPEGAEIPLAAKRCPRWIYPNADERGYFRFALPREGLTALVKGARSLPPAERLGLVADTSALVETGDADADALLDLLEALRGERDRRVVDQMILALARLGRGAVDDASRPAFRALVSRLFLPTARELGFDPKKGEPDDRRLLRVRVLSALADLADDPWVLAEAEKRAPLCLADPRKVASDVAPVVLSAGSRRAGEKRFAELVAAAQRAATPEDRRAAMNALGGFADARLLRRALDLMVGSSLKIQDGFHVFTAAMARPEARPVVLAWARDRFGELRGKLPDFALSRLAGVVEAICDARTLEDAASFFGEALIGAEGGERALVQALEKAERCVDVRARETDRVKKRLAR